MVDDVLARRVHRCLRWSPDVMDQPDVVGQSQLVLHELSRCGA